MKLYIKAIGGRIMNTKRNDFILIFGLLAFCLLFLLFSIIFSSKDDLVANVYYDDEIICSADDLDKMIVDIEIIGYQEIPDAPLWIPKYIVREEFDHCTFRSWLKWSIKNFYELLEKRYLKNS